ncbi:DUF560 domain-containing protein [Sphingomonas rhizophila]|uniref:DUF560 domain-containing protein n=1 Tax=Sphingomonas rhizophila TaxID=2071607 RepID=A0A7G9SCU6_9SPHN|nr:surface lipoprotein assembly modifier [Sphingomonas rhizophila]QNN65671.1 DUF560 domain-containing protein [Sphingomonas rhizophila]
MMTAIALTSAVPTSAVAGEREFSATSLLALAQKLERSGHRDEAARLYQALTEDPNPDIRAEAQFRTARYLAGEGKTREAAVLLRRLIDEHPKAAPPRFELVGLLQKMGDEAAALRELRSLGTLDLPMNAARLVDRMSASLRANQPFSFQLEMAIAPDSNVNRATRSDTLDTVFGEFEVNESARAKSGLGASIRGLAQGRVDLTEDTALKLYASFDSNLYRQRRFNDISLSAGLGPEFRIGSTRLALNVGGSQQWYGMRSFVRSLRAGGTAWLSVDRMSQLRLDGSARWTNNLFNDQQDGRGRSVTARYERALSPRLVASVGGGIDRFAATGPAYSTRSRSASINLYRDMGRATVSLGVEVGRLKADERLSLLPKVRQDRSLRLQAGMVLRKLTFAGFAPTVRVTHERNSSTVEFYDYRRTRTEFGISRAF